MKTGGRATGEGSGTGVQGSANTGAKLSETDDISLRAGDFKAPTVDDEDAYPPLVDPEDSEFVEWAARTEEEVDDSDEDLPIEQLLTLDSESAVPIGPNPLEEELVIDDNFVEDVDDEEDDGDEDEEDDVDEDDEDDEDDDEDEELAAQADLEDFDADDGDVLPVSTLSKRGRGPAAARSLGGVEADDNDEVADDEEFLEAVVDDLPLAFEENVVDDTRAALGGASETETALIDPDVEMDDEVLFEEETDDDIQSAADILSSSGLLGLGVDGGKRTDMSAVTSFALGGEESGKGAEATLGDPAFSPAALQIGDDDDVDDLEDEEEEGEGEVEEEEGEGLDSYAESDADDTEEDDEFTLTSQSSFGRVWELNDDNYVTITEPGQSYAYELDEEDEEDQEMATARRGKQGGWSGGLASNSSSQLPKGSKEWIARRSYELVAESNQREMFRWTRRHQEAPAAIAALYPKTGPVPSMLGKTTLQFSSPDSIPAIIGTDSSASQLDGDAVPAVTVGEPPNQNALERAMKFPSQYRFKLEGSGDNFIECLNGVIERVMGQKLPESAFQVEPAGRYQRVLIVVEVESARQVTDLYDALRSHPSVKFSYG